ADVKKKALRGGRLSTGETVKGSGLILACGHSAGDFFHTLRDQGVRIEAKSFALGVRWEHPQAFINQGQYGRHSAKEDLEAAQYKMSTYWEEEKMGVYSFCMCPGGYVISSTTDDQTIVVNGMSNYHRNSPWANAAIVCTVAQENFEGSDPFKMMRFQREIEQGFYRASAAKGEPLRIPAQRLEDFLAGYSGRVTAKSSCPSGIVDADLSSLLPDWIVKRLKEGIEDFNQRRRGFAYADAVLHGVESRTSSPIRITRAPATFT